MAHYTLNAASLALDASGVGAALSWIPDFLDAGVSLLEGDWTGAAMSAGAAIPYAGAASNVAKMGRTAARGAAQGARLTEHLRQLEKYGGSGYRELANGRIRYYGNLEAARTAGPMAGRRLVREWDPASGATRTWHETLDTAGRTRIVRPETGGPKIHYEFDEAGNYVGQW
jgi:hypothetical protein